MARILVEADDQRAVLLDERNIKPELMRDRHAAVQLIERVAWAVSDEDRGSERRPVSLAGQPALERTFD